MEVQERTVQVGDFFEESWGYEQTNVDFYEVVRVSASGKTAWLQHVQSAFVRCDGGPADYVAPVPGAFDRAGTDSRDGLLKRQLRWFDCGNGPTCSINMTSYSNAYLWGCKPAYQTGANWGH